WSGDNVEESRTLARKLNEYGATMVKDHPGRYGLFACIAPPDVQGSLKEIEYAFDTLKADGIGLLTSYQDKYLGDPSFAPIYEELNARRAVVYVHPTTPACCRGLLPGIPPSSIEYATDSTRTIAHLVFGGMTTKYPDIRWIFSHSGGTLPFLTGRFVRLAEERKVAHLPNGPVPEFRKFHYELAQGNTPGQIAALLKMVPVAQVLYGTDYPFRNGAEVNRGIADWGFSAADLSAVERETALKLLPRIKAGGPFRRSVRGISYGWAPEPRRAGTGVAAERRYACRPALLGPTLSEQAGAGGRAIRGGRHARPGRAHRQPAAHRPDRAELRGREPRRRRRRDR